jgi:potassium efflux system protein
LPDDVLTGTMESSARKAGFWSRELNRVQKWLLLALMIGAMHPASAQVTPEPSQLSQELVSARIQTLREAGSQEGSDATLDNYAQVLNWLGEAQAHAAAEKTYLASLTAAPKTEADIRARMETKDYAAPDINPASVSRLSNSKIGDKLTSYRVQLLDASAAKDNLDRRIASEQSSAPSVQTRFDAIDTRLQALHADVISIEPDIQPSQFESQQWSVLAERTALVAERRALEARLSSQPVRYSRRKAESDELTLVVDGLQTAVDTLEAELATRAENLEQESRIKLDENAPGYTFVHRFLQENEGLRSLRTDLVTTLEVLKEEEARVKQTRLLLVEQFDAVKQIVELAQNSASLGHVLMAHWHQADAFRLHVAKLSSAGNIGEHVIQRAKYKEQEATLSNTSIERSMDSDTGKSMLEEAKNEVRAQRALLTELIALETELINIQGATDRTHQRLETQFDAYQRYLSSRILWVPSHPAISLGSAGDIKGEFAGFRDKLADMRLAQLKPATSVLLILALASLALGRKLYMRLQALNAKVGRARDDSIRHTFHALLLTLARIIPLPLLLLFFATGVETSANAATPYLTASLIHAAETLFLILLLRTSCEENGLASVHFGWTHTSCKNIRRLTSTLLLWWWPLALVTAFILTTEVDSISAVFGRLFFCLNMSILGVTLLRFTWPQRDDTGDYRRWRILGAWLVIAAAVFFVACGISGYIYSAKIMYDALIETLMIAIGLMFLYHLMQRWLLVVRRRLRFRELLAARQALADDQEREAEPEDVDLLTLSAAVSQLLTSGTLALGVLGFAYVWAPLFRALEALQTVTLWTVRDTSDGETIVASITLASLALALLIGVITFVAARNVPQLLALLLMGRKGSTPGSRYAIRKLLGYSIVGVGVIAVLSTLGLQWDRLQWLVAALGVGIGFGLQEIIANFISGLIILFERPIRVGDLITVGDSSGQVIRIHIRATTIRDFDGKELLVPNKEFVTGRLLNWTLSNSDIRMILEVGIAYGSDVRKAVTILEELLRSHDLILDNPPPDVIFQEFGNSSLKLLARYFFNDVDRRAFLLHDLHMKINDAFKEGGIVIAFPQIDVHMDPDRVSP